MFDKYKNKLRNLICTIVEDKLSASKEKITEMDIKTCEIQKCIEVLETKIQELETKIQVSETKIQVLETKIQVLQDGNIQLQTEIEKNDDSIKQIIENLQNNNEVLQLITKNLDTINPIVPKIEKVIDKIEYFDGKIEMLSVKLKSMKSMQNNSTRQQNEIVEIASNTSVSHKSDYSTMDYFDFENYFRGSREHIKETQKQYVQYFENFNSVLDLGCGRGEFLELLKENNISAVGVDYYNEYAEYCLMKGLEAVCSDANNYLEHSEKVDGIFMGQVAEHLSTQQLIRLCELCFEKLNKGGCAIFETPNPTSLAIYTNSFYMDPSHQKPVHPMTFKYFLEKAGFKNIQILYTENSKLNVIIPPIKLSENEEEFNDAMSLVQDVLFGSQDYAIIARK